MENELLQIKERNNPKLSILSTKGQLVIPKELRESLALQPGESVIMLEVKGGLYLRKFDDQLFHKVMKDLEKQSTFKTDFTK